MTRSTALMANCIILVDPSQRAHDVKMTSYQRRCDVMTSHRRRSDVILTLCACWVKLPGLMLSSECYILPYGSAGNSWCTQDRAPRGKYLSTWVYASARAYASAQMNAWISLFVCLSELMLYVPVNSNGHVETLSPFYGTFTQH